MVGVLIGEACPHRTGPPPGRPIETFNDVHAAVLAVPPTPPVNSPRSYCIQRHPTTGRAADGGPSPSGRPVLDHLRIARAARTGYRLHFSTRTYIGGRSTWKPGFTSARRSRGWKSWAGKT